MSTRHSRQNIGWAEEAIIGTSPLADVGVTAYYYFGPYAATPGEMPSYEKTFIPYYTSSVEADEMVHVEDKITQSLAFIMTNGLMDYYLYGDVTNGGGASPESTHTLAFHAIPLTFTVRWESGYSTQATVIKREITNCKIQSRVINWDFVEDGNAVTMGINIEGLGYGAALDNDAIAAPIFAKSTNQTVDLPFIKGVSSSEVIEWESTTKTSAIDWSGVLLKCTLTSARNIKKIKYDSSTTSSFHTSGKVEHVVEFIIRRDTVTAGSTDFLDDFEASGSSGTDDLQIKLFSDATRYMDIDMQGIRLASVKPNIAILGNNEVPIYECAGTVQNVVPIYLDGVADARYTDQ